VVTVNPRRRLLVVLGCAVCVLLVASLFPAADPRIEVSSGSPGDGGGTGPSTGTESSTRTPAAGVDTPQENPKEENETDTGPEIRPTIDTAAIPGETVRLSVDEQDLADSQYQQVELRVDGESAGTVGTNESIPYNIPSETRAFDLTVNETGDSVTVQTDRTIRIQTTGTRVPGGEIELKATAAGGYEVTDANVTINGTQTSTGPYTGTATVPLPEAAGETEIQVERGAMYGNTTVVVQEPEIAVTTPNPLLLPGVPAHVSVTVDDTSVANATVTLSDGSQVTTGDNGARVSMPVTNEVTLSTTVGDEGASTTIGGLYLRTMFVVLVLPGLAIGLVWSYLRLVPDSRQTSVSGSVVTLAGLLGGVTAALAAIRLPRPSLSGFRVPRPSLDYSAPDLSLPRVSPSLPSPSLGSLFGSVVTSGASSQQSTLSSISGFFGSDDTNDDTANSREATGESPPDPEDPAPDEHTQLRTTWHRFLDQVGVTNRETQTPGEATRIAIAAGYPRRSVARLLTIFRAVEYGSENPSQETVSEAQESLDTIENHDPEDDSQ
jgi:hypothetical protein